MLISLQSFSKSFIAFNQIGYSSDSSHSSFSSESFLIFLTARLAFEMSFFQLPTTVNYFSESTSNSSLTEGRMTRCKNMLLGDVIAFFEITCKVSLALLVLYILHLHVLHHFQTIRFQNLCF